MPLVFGIEIIARDTIKYNARGRFNMARLRAVNDPQLYDRISVHVMGPGWFSAMNPVAQ